MNNNISEGASPAQSQADIAQNDLVTIAGGKEIKVTHQDGTQETVKVRQIPISKIQQFIFAIGIGKTDTEIALLCDKMPPPAPKPKEGEQPPPPPPEWADTLDANSVIEIVRVGREINVPFVNAWLAHRAEWKKELEPAMPGTAANAETEKQPNSPLPTSAPMSPSTTS